MLKRLHNHIYAQKLKQLFTDNPLVLVSQTLGSVDQHAIKNDLQDNLTKRLPKSDVHVEICRINNAVAAGTGSEAFGNLFHTSNLLIGFSTPLYNPNHQAGQQQQQQQQQPDDQDQQQRQGRVVKGVGLEQLVGGLFEQQLPGPHVPHPVLRGVVETALGLTQQHPLVLLGAFYKREHVNMTDLSDWIKLDDRQVCVGWGGVGRGKGFGSWPR
jgi:hypothetical protein